MSIGQTRLARYLAYAGIVPPWLALLLHLLVGLPWADHAALTYGAMIGSFVCGMHWGLHMQPLAPMPINLLITSNVGALVAWGMLLAAQWSSSIAFLGLVGVLGALLMVDRRLLAAGVIAPWFWTVRRNASMGLGAALIFWSILA